MHTLFLHHMQLRACCTRQSQHYHVSPQGLQNKASQAIALTEMMHVQVCGHCKSCPFCILVGSCNRPSTDFDRILVLSCMLTMMAKCACRDVAARRVRFSHYLGVSWNKQRQQWQARFHKSDGSSHLVGGFDGEEEAGRAYDEYALEHYGNGAVRNFPPSTYTGEATL